ncbi:MAG: hypothetical protein Q9165_004051 [Trypethelium subeluteriae]
MASEPLSCPFCGYETEDSYTITLHVEQYHTDDSPFQVKDTSPLLQLPNQHRSNTLSDYYASIKESQDEWVRCPQEECGEEVLLEELNEHLDLHYAEKMSSEDDASVTRSNMASSASSLYSFVHTHSSSHLPQDSQQQSLPHRLESPPNSSGKTGLRRSIKAVSSAAKQPQPSNKRHDSPNSNNLRLGKAELGPYAFEKQMPAWLHAQLSTGGKTTLTTRISPTGQLYTTRTTENEIPGLLPLLARLLASDPSVAIASLCHPSVQHISKLPREGGFCGYRNAQMLISYLRGVRAPGWDAFGGGGGGGGNAGRGGRGEKEWEDEQVPGVLELQEGIEAAWDRGLYALGREQTGGIRGTRKYIGTPEVAALLAGLGVEFEARGFHDDERGRSGGRTAVAQLVDFVEEYFERAAVDGADVKVRKTLMPPIYLQRPGHSLTIVGLEVQKDGSKNLLVFDPMYVVSKEMRRLKDGLNRRPQATAPLLRMYRRGMANLSRYRDFETIELTAPAPPSPAWDDV